MMEKLLRKSWGVLVMAVMFATVVSAQDLASLERNSSNSINQPGNSMQTNSENFQEKKVTGTVLSGDNDEGLPGVNVVVKGTATGGITGLDGSYAVDVPDGEAILIFSSVGYITEEIAVGNRSVVDMTLMPDITALDEVVVIGYGTAKRKDVTGSIVTVQADDFEMYQFSNVTELLRSTVPGLKVGYSTDARNIPDFEIRGDNTIKADNDDETNANKPLIVLDGVIFTGDIATINVNDVQSIDVLKDASAAAIYGSRASNGVIVFTTKRGVMGKPVIRMNAKVGVVHGARRVATHKYGDDNVMLWLTDLNEAITGTAADPWSRYEQYSKVPSEYQSEWLVENGIPGETDPLVITNQWLDQLGFEQDEKENYHAGEGYDWADAVFQTGMRQDYNVSVSGRTDKVAYYWSVGYMENESVQVGDKFTQLTTRLNVDITVTDWLSMGVRANFAYQNEGPLSISNDGSSYRTGSPYDNPWFNGTERIRENLKPFTAGSNRGNPLINPAWTTRQHDRYRMNPTTYFKITFPYAITLTTNFTQSLDFRQRFDYEDSENPRWTHGGDVRRRHNRAYGWQLDNILNWTQEYGDHRFAVTGLVNAQKDQSWFTDARSSNFSPTEALGYHAIQFGLAPSVSSNDQVVSRTAIMGRVNYAFKDRYNLSASIREDGYSRFGSNFVHATFPSISGAWSITDESFMAGKDGWLNSLKLRASWGKNGNSSGLTAYQAYAVLDNRTYLNWDGGYFVAPYLEIDRIGNNDLAWETNAAWNFGLDYSMFNGRVRGALDVYTSETTELLLNKKLPIITGFDDVITNIGSLTNSGFDFAINTVNIQKSYFTWTTSLNSTYNTNKITSLTGEFSEVTDENGNISLEEPDDTDNGWFIGENKDVIWNYETDGVYQIGDEAEAAVYGLFPGDFRIVDQNDDKILNSKDKVFQGVESNPWYVTLRNDITYKNFDFGFIFLAKFGKDYMGGSVEPFNQNQSYIKNHNWYDYPYWTPNNQINDAARINSIRLSSEMEAYESRSYIRLQNLALGYNFPTSILESINFNTARVSFNIENAFVATKWIQGDPESIREMPRTYSFSIDFSF